MTLIDFIPSLRSVIGIYSFYRAKYREAVGDLPSEANQEFADTLKEIFKKNN